MASKRPALQTQRKQNSAADQLTEEAERLGAEWNSRSGKSQVTVTLWPYGGAWFDHDLELLSHWATFSDIEGAAGWIHPELWGSENESEKT